MSRIKVDGLFSSFEIESEPMQWITMPAQESEFNCPMCQRGEPCADEQRRLQKENERLRGVLEAVKHQLYRTAIHSNPASIGKNLHEAIKIVEAELALEESS